GGEDALLSGRAAGHLLGVVKDRPPAPEVTAPTERRVPGVATRRSRKMDPRESMTWRGIPVTTVARTLVDLAGILSLDALARACHEAGVQHGATPAAVDAVLARHRGTPGAGRLRRVLHGEVRVTLSVMEAHFLTLLRESNLALPETNRRAGGR